MKNRLLIGLLFLNSVAQSQIAVTNTGILYLKTSSDIFYSTGDFTNTSSASFTNNGSFYFKGNITSSEASMANGTGTVFLNGTALQTISGTQPFKVYNLTTDNAAGIQLNTNLSVSGVHTFSSGILTTSSTPNYIIYEAGASYTGASDAKHVNGWIKKIGNTDFTFPTGSGTYLREISLSNLAGVSEFDAQYSGLTYDASSVQFPIASMNPGEYWTVNQVSGSNALVQLNWDSSKVPFPNYAVADLRTSFYSGTQWTEVGGTATGSVATTGTITSNSVGSFGRFAIASISYPLPLKFLGISAVFENSSVRIKWQTANEVRVQNYSVQRSSDGIHYSTIATINAVNKNYQSYQFLDRNAASSSKLCYRVQANDIDGRTNYSKVVILTATGIQKIQLVTNPARDFIQLTTQNLPSSVYFYRLINSAGQVCKKGSFSCEGLSFITLPANAIPSGQYTLVIFRAAEEKQFKILIQ